VVSEEAARQYKIAWWLMDYQTDGQHDEQLVRTSYQISTIYWEYTVPDPTLMAWKVSTHIISGYRFKMDHF
jgi:hypothetical protein